MEKCFGENGGPQTSAVIGLTGGFGLRTGEALAMWRPDIDLHSKVPRLRVTG